jgi:hypothetical protein
MKIFREWVRMNASHRFGRPATDQEVAEDLQIIRNRQFQSARQVEDYATFVKQFAIDWASLNRKKRAKAAAAKRWSKE